MLVNVLVQSDLSAPANGYLQITIDNSHPTGDLITKFCEDKVKLRDICQKISTWRIGWMNDKDGNYK